MSLFEKCFGVIECLEERKVKLVIFLLQSSPKDWWTLHAAKAGEMSYVSWKGFLKAFQSKFYPRSFCDAKRNEFMSLVQGDVTIVEYEKKFTELAKYALSFVIDEIDKCK